MAQAHMDQNRHILSRHMHHMDLDMDLAGAEHQKIKKTVKTFNHCQFHFYFCQFKKITS